MTKSRFFRNLAFAGVCFFVLGIGIELLRGEPVTVDLAVIVDQLVQRANQMESGTICSREYRLRMSLAQWESVKQFVRASQHQPNPTLTGDIDSLITTQADHIKEAWNVRIAFSNDDSCVYRTRVDGVDNTIHYLQGIAGSGTLVQRPIHSEVKSSLGGIRLRLVDGFVLFRQAHSDGTPPEMLIDVSLAPWENVLQSAPLPGQSIVGASSESLRRITYATAHANGTRSQTTYDFDAALGWAPLAVVMSRDEKIVDERIYGFTELSSFTRPSVSLHGIHRLDGLVDVSVGLVQSWSGSVLAEDFAFREPPLRVEVDSLNGTLELMMPPYLEAADAISRPAVGVSAVIQAWGTNNSDADFNTDGNVDGADIDFLLSHL